MAALIAFLAAPAPAKDVARFAVNEYFGMTYRQEPVSFDVQFDEPLPAAMIGLRPGPCQVEIVEGTPQAVRKARVWTLVSFDAGRARQVVFTVHTDAAGAKRTEPPAGGPAAQDAGKIGGVPVAVISNGLISVKVPVGSVTFDEPASPLEVPAPVVSISRDVPGRQAGGREWIGSGYLDSHLRVRSIACQVSRGSVYAESRIHYAFENGRSYRARARVYASKPYVQLVEDFDLGGASRFVFNYDDWFADAFFRPEDQRLVQWASIRMDNPCGDFVRLDGQEALARLVVWSQFNYFRGKQETIALKAPDAQALEAAHEAAVASYQRDLARYQEQLADSRQQWLRYEQDKRKYAEDLAKYKELLAAYEEDPKSVKKPKEPRPPREPRKRAFREPRPPEKPEYEEIAHALAGAPIRATSVATPGGDATAVGGFYIRPDRWTRAKVNHVDMTMRPEVPGDRQTRGIVGLKGARSRIAMEAWLVEGHREWAIFAIRAGDDAWMAKAHVTEGVWPLDRIRRLTLAWNSDGSEVSPEDTRPPEKGSAGGPAGSVLMGTRGRSGLQYFNGSNGQIRWKPPTEGFDGKLTATKAEAGGVLQMAGQAMTWYMAGDESAYPAVRAMLPWTDGEALNPFYQGMENMNFSADLYRYMAGHAVRLLKMGHPEGQRMLGESEKRFDMALDRYVYPRSGCWEESHGYAGHTIGITGPLALLLRNSGKRNFIEDLRFARMMEFFLYVHSPIDAEWGSRLVPAIGDHGQSRAGPAERFRNIIGVFADAKDPEIRRIVSRAAWMIREDGGQGPEGVQPERPDLRSRWLQGYGTVMRAFGSDGPGMLALRPQDAPVKQAGRPESFLVLRAGQSWGHHHEDKGSMWFWGRNVHFFGDCDWGAPPGGTYWNQYKQGPASGTQIELVGVTNWTLPCKYAAPWISDDEYAADYDYANARCMYPFNPKLDLSRSTPVALRNGYDRQVLFVHGDLLIVRDNVETMCPTIWRMHSFQPKGTSVNAGRATLASPQGPTGELAILYPAEGVKLRTVDRDILNARYFDDAGKPLPFEQLPKFTSSLELRWDMPPNTSATWVFGVHDADEPAPKAELIDPQGRAIRVKLPDGRDITALLNIEPFRFSGDGVEFEGTVGLILREKDGRRKTYPIRGQFRGGT